MPALEPIRRTAPALSTARSLPPLTSATKR